MKPDITFERVKKFVSDSKGELISAGFKQFIKKYKPTDRKKNKNPDAVIKTVGDLRRALEGISDDVVVIGETTMNKSVKVRGNLRYNWIAISVPEERGPANGW